MIGLVLYLLPRDGVLVQFIFSLIITDIKITSLVYNLILNFQQMPRKLFLIKVN